MSKRTNKRHQHKKMRYLKIKSDHSIDLSDFEDAADRSFFVRIGQDAAKNAINENKAFCLPITFFLDGWVVQRMPNGDIQKVIEVKTSDRTKYRRIAKGTVLHVRRSGLL